MSRTFLNIAHRGASGRCPENTMAAFRAAMKAGADAIELDLHQTRDGHLVVLHDFNLKRTTGDPRPVREVGLKEIRRLDAGSWRGPAFRGERIPTLEEVLDWARGRIDLYLELKRGSPFYPGIESRLLEGIKKSGGRGWTTVSSFDPDALETLRRLDPDLSLGILTRKTSPRSILDTARRLAARSLHLSTRRFSTSLLHQAHIQGFRVFVYAVNEEAATRNYIALGVDGVFTNYPERLASLLKKLKTT
jgi:glycerophosphoryl diester phosphodiesterase